MQVFVSWLFSGFLLYTGVRKYRAGTGFGRTILWFLWTQLWVGVLALLVSQPLGPVGGLILYLAYAVWQMNGWSFVTNADHFFTSQYGRLTWYNVRYLGGHPEFRNAGVKGVLLVTLSGLILVDKYRANATTLCTIPIDRIIGADVIGTVHKTVAWAPGMPLPMTFSSDHGTLAVQFLNDLNGTSMANFDAGTIGRAASLKNQVHYAIYDWKRSRVNPG